MRNVFISHHAPLPPVVLTLRLLLLPHPDYLQYLIFVKILEAGTGNDLLVVFLSEEETRVLESLAVEGVAVLEDVAHVFH
jgi:hypothetical protein